MDLQTTGDFFMARASFGGCIQSCNVWRVTATFGERDFIGLCIISNFKNSDNEKRQAL